MISKTIYSHNYCCLVEKRYAAALTTNNLKYDQSPEIVAGIIWFAVDRFSAL